MKFTFSTFLFLGWHLLFVGLLVLLLADSFGSPTTTTSILNFPAYYLIVPFLVSQLLLRFFSDIRFNKIISRLLLLVTVSLFLLVAGLSFYWTNSYENAVFELTRLHPQGLTLILILISFSWLINQSTKWWESHWTKVILLLPVVAYAVFYFISLWHFNIFKEVVKEDRAIEYAQFWILSVAGVLQLYKSYVLFGKKKLFLALLHGFVGLAFIAVAGDEISWGQRLFGIEVSEELEEINRQGEITFHNLYAVEWLVIYAYIIGSLFGLCAHWILAVFKPLRKFQAWVPSPLLFGYFLLPDVFFIQQIRVKYGIWHSWSEVAELYLYTGVALWWVMLGGQLLHKKLFKA